MHGCSKFLWKCLKKKDAELIIFMLEPPIQHKSKIFEKATECRFYDQPKIRRIAVLGKFAQNDFRRILG
jgi:hypothetical protein